MHMPSPPDPPSPPVDPALVRAAIEDANDFEALREVYRRASRAKQLDVVLDTGEAVRDAITSRRLLLEAKEEAEKAETEAATPEQATPEERTADKVTAALEAEREQAVAEALDKIGQRE